MLEKYLFYSKYLKRAWNNEIIMNELWEHLNNINEDDKITN